MTFKLKHNIPQKNTMEYLRIRNELLSKKDPEKYARLIKKNNSSPEKYIKETKKNITDKKQEPFSDYNNDVPLISFIIPVYNCRDYISRCIDSILNQTIKNIEIIIINDGSTDNVENILEEYSKKNQNIRIINQQNKGVSFTRNIGIENSNGLYLSFIDGDDCIRNTMAYDTLSKALNNDLDICFFDFRTFKNDEIINDTYYISNNLDNAPINKVIMPNNIKIFNRLCRNCWSAIYKRDFLIKNNLRFNQNTGIGEDALFKFESLLYSKKIMFINDYYYYYYYSQNPNSCSSNINNKNLKEFVDKSIKAYLDELFILYFKYLNTNKYLIYKYLNFMLYELLLYIRTYSELTVFIDNRLKYISKEIYGKDINSLNYIDKINTIIKSKNVVNIESLICNDITVAVCTQEYRKYNLLNTIKTLLPQCTRICVCLNNYSEVPRELMNNKKIIYISAGKYEKYKDLGCMNKMFWCGTYDGYYATIDDDIIYPNNYLLNLKNKLDQYNKNVICSLYGYYFDIKNGILCDQLYRFHFIDKIYDDNFLHVVGMGCAMMYPSKIKTNRYMYLSRPKNFGDDEITAVYAQQHNIPMIRISNQDFQLEMDIELNNRGLWTNPKGQEERRNYLRSYKNWKLNTNY